VFIFLFLPTGSLVCWLEVHYRRGGGGRGGERSVFILVGFTTLVGFEDDG
jgi:hypothetical protein